MTTQHSQGTDFHASGAIRIRNPSKEWPQTHVLDRAASGIGQGSVPFLIIRF